MNSKVSNNINSIIRGIEDSIKIDKPKSEIKICVAMSGGVDSSVCPIFFKEAGYNVSGITLKLYESSVERDNACCSFRDIYDAKRVAEQFQFPHYVINYEKEFKEKVIDSFIQDYFSGRTPIPCVKCNQVIKFNYLFQLIQDLEFDFLVTGHYILKKNNNLHIAHDKTKDQSYFLYNLTEKQLKHLIFPLGGLLKSETREIAQHFGMKAAVKPDSQDICFVEDGSYRNFIAQNSEKDIDRSGDFVDINGKKLGRHEGIHNFTIGQRKGVGISAANPMYVISIDQETNEVTIGEKESLAKYEVKFNEITWANEDVDYHEKPLQVRLRSMQKNTNAILYNHGDHWLAKLESPQYFVSPGQACVVYDGDRLLGGGTII